MSKPSALFVGLGEVELHLPGARSLKEKRHHVRSLVDRLKHRHAVLVVECGHQELHQRSALAITSLASEADAARSTVERALDFIHQSFAGTVVAEAVDVEQLR